MSTIEQATEVVQNLIEQGVDDIIENSENFIDNLRIASGIKKPKMVTKTSGASRGSLASINEILSKDGMKIDRDTNKWPLYHLFKDSELVNSYLFKGKVSELYDIISTQGIDGINQYKQS